MVWDAWPSTLTATVTNPPAVDDFAVKVIVAYQTGMRSDFADLRFSKDGVALSHTIWAYTASTEAEVWVKIPSGTTAFTLHYGNASAEDASDPDNTFLLCDRFDGYITTRWNHKYAGESDSSAIINASNELEISPPTDKTPGSMRGLVSKTTFSKGIVVEYNDKLTGNTFYPGITIGTGNIVDFNGASTRWDQCAHETGYSVVTTSTRYLDDGIYLQRNLSGGAGVIQVGGPGYDLVDTFSIKRFIWAANNYLAFENSGTVVVSGTDSTWQSLTGAELVIYQGWYGGNGGTRVMDWIRVRPYQATEPTVTLSEPEPVGLQLNPVADASVYRHNMNGTTFADLRGGSGTFNYLTDATAYAPCIESHHTADLYKWIGRSIFVFNTNGLIPDGKAVATATLRIYRSGPTANYLGGFAIGVTACTPTDPTNLSMSDYNKTALSNIVELADRVPAAELNGDYVEFTLNAEGIAYLNNAGYTSLMLRCSHDLDNVAPTWASATRNEFNLYHVEEQDSSLRPTLTVTFRDIVYEDMEGTIEAVSDSDADLEIPAAPSGTLTLYPVDDSYHEHRVNNSTLATLIAAAGTGGARTDTSSWACNLETAANTQTDKFLVLTRGIFSFDTSDLPDNATITGATLKMVRSGGNNLLGDFEICLVGASPADPTNHNITDTNNDYPNVGSTEFASRVAFADWAYLAQHTFTLNAAGRAAINKSGYTSFAVRIGWDMDGSFTGTWGAEKWSELFVYTVNDATQANRPVLEITYTTGATHELAGTVEAAAGTEGATTRLRSAGGAIAISATVGTPMLVRLRGISGAPGAVSVSTGYLQALLDLYGAAISVQAGLSGVITRLRSLIGSAPGTGVLSGALQATNLISGAIPCTASISGLLKATLPVTALTVSATSSCSGQIQVIANLYGAIPANAATLESLLRATTPLTGTILPAQALVAGTLQVEAVLEVPLAAVTGATGTVIRLRGVAGRVETIGAATGHLEAINQITGTIHAVSSGIGNLHAPVPLTGEIHEVSGAAGIVYSGRVAVLVPGTSAGTGVTVASPITRLRSCSGVTRGRSAVNGDLAPAVPLFADLVASSGTLADLTVGQEILFSGDTSATSLLSASLNAVISLNGALNTEGKVTGLIACVASLTGSVLEASGANGNLAGPKLLYGAINSGSSINGEIYAACSVNGTISCESSVGGNLTAIAPLNIECTVTGGLNGVLAVPQVERLTGAFPATGSCAGSIAVTVRLETAIASISEIFGDLKSGVAFSSEVTPVSSVTGELSLRKAVELGGSISAVSINSGIANTRRSLTCEGAAASTTVSVWLSRAIPITGVVLEASWGQADIDHSASLSGTIAAYSGIQGSLGARSIRAATSCMEACVASTTREAICVRETVGYAVPITAKVSYTFSFTVTSSTRKIVAKTVYSEVSNQYKEYRVFALPDDLNVGEEVLDCYVVVTMSEFRVVGLKEDILVTEVDY